MSTATHDDLDQARALLDGPPEGVEKLWSKVNDLAQHRRIDPELSRDLGISKRTLGRWHRQRIGPPRTVIGRTILYRRTAVQEWLRSREERKASR